MKSAPPEGGGLTGAAFRHHTDGLRTGQYPPGYTCGIRSDALAGVESWAI